METVLLILIELTLLALLGLCIFKLIKRPKIEKPEKKPYNKKRRRLVFITFLILFGILLLSGSATVIYSTKNLPKDYKNAISNVKINSFDPYQTDISKPFLQDFQNNPGKSGAILVKSGKLAFFHRIALVRMAKHSIELQTYIYENDPTSRLLMQEMKMAADRGVQVRIIVDDHGLSSDTDDIMTLNYHPNIHVKVFNPYKYRSKLLKYPQFLLNINRLNYRMHNKLFIVDNSAVIVGGRNIASNYFDESPKMNFSDTDVLFVGKIAQDAKASFNEYWDYHKSIPVDVFPNKDTPQELEELDKLRDFYMTAYKRKAQIYESEINMFIKNFNDKNFKIYWGGTKLIADKPSKAEGGHHVSPIIEALNGLWKETKKSIYIAAAYLVPGKEGANNLVKSAQNGISVNILTNSLSSTDATAVYAGWERYRNKFVKNNINVYEFRKEAYRANFSHNSGASLHSKTIVVDDEISWIGSFNLDGRSAIYNTEIIAVFSNREFAQVMKETMEEEMNEYLSWHLINDNGTVKWTTLREAKRITVKHSPDTNIFTRGLLGILRFIPEKLI